MSLMMTPVLEVEAWMNWPPADVDTHVGGTAGTAARLQRRTRSPGWSSLIETEVPLLI